MPGPSQNQPQEFKIPVTTGETSGQPGPSTVPERDAKPEPKPIDIRRPEQTQPVNVSVQPDEASDPAKQQALNEINVAADISGRAYREENAAPAVQPLEITGDKQPDLVRNALSGGDKDLAVLEQGVGDPIKVKVGEEPEAEVVEEPPDVPAPVGPPVIAKPPAQPIETAPSTPPALTTPPPPVGYVAQEEALAITMPPAPAAVTESPVLPDQPVAEVPALPVQPTAPVAAPVMEPVQTIPGPALPRTNITGDEAFDAIPVPEAPTSLALPATYPEIKPDEGPAVGQNGLELAVSYHATNSEILAMTTEQLGKLIEDQKVITMQKESEYREGLASPKDLTAFVRAARIYELENNYLLLLRDALASKEMEDYINQTEQGPAVAGGVG